MLANPSISGAETATLDAGAGSLLSASITAAENAATAVIRTGGSDGTILCKLAAAIGTTASRNYVAGVPYSNLHITVTGTDPVFDVEVGV